MGGMIALALALERPEAVGSLVLLATTPARADPITGDVGAKLRDFSSSPPSRPRD